MELLVKVAPRSAKTELAGRMADGAWKIRVAAPPDKGRANEALCAFIAAHFRVPRSRVRIVAGLTSTRKRVVVDGVTAPPES